MARKGSSKYSGIEWLGKKFNSLTVVGQLGVTADSSGTFYWSTQCDCGRTFRTRAQHVVDGKVKTCTFCRHQSARLSGFSPAFLSSYRIRAAKAGREFSIDVCDLEALYDKQRGICALTGETLTLPVKASGDFSYNVSIDRVDSKLGYTVCNIQLVTKEVNIHKFDMSNEAFVELCRKVVAYAREEKQLELPLEPPETE